MRLAQLENTKQLNLPASGTVLVGEGYMVTKRVSDEKFNARNKQHKGNPTFAKNPLKCKPNGMGII